MIGAKRNTAEGGRNSLPYPSKFRSKTLSFYIKKMNVYKDFMHQPIILMAPKQTL